MICAPFSTWSRAIAQCLGVVAVGDQAAELRRAGDVGAFADVDERDVVGQRERLETRQLQGASPLDWTARRLAGDGVGDRRDVRGRRAAAAADDVDEAGIGELAEDRGGLVRRLVVAAEGVRQAGVGVRADQRVGDRRELLDVRPHLRAAERAVEADRQRVGMADRLPERCRSSGPTACGRSGR